jgi:hypothetical protein
LVLTRTPGSGRVWGVNWTGYERQSTEDQRRLAFYAEMPRDARGYRAGQAVVNDLIAAEAALDVLQDAIPKLIADGIAEHERRRVG